MFPRCVRLASERRSICVATKGLAWFRCCLGSSYACIWCLLWCCAFACPPPYAVSVALRLTGLPRVCFRLGFSGEAAVVSATCSPRRHGVFTTTRERHPRPVPVERRLTSRINLASNPGTPSMTCAAAVAKHGARAVLLARAFGFVSPEGFSGRLLLAADLL